MCSSSVSCLCLIVPGLWQTWFSFFFQQNKANQNRTQISRVHILLQTSLTLYLLRGSCWTRISTQGTAGVAWEAAMRSGGVWADTAAEFMAYSGTANTHNRSNENNAKFDCCHPCVSLFHSNYFYFVSEWQQKLTKYFLSIQFWPKGRT